MNNPKKWALWSLLAAAAIVVVILAAGWFFDVNYKKMAAECESNPDKEWNWDAIKCEERNK